MQKRHQVRFPLPGHPQGTPPALISIPPTTSTFNGSLMGASLKRPCRHGLQKKAPGSIHVTNSRVGLVMDVGACAAVGGHPACSQLATFLHVAIASSAPTA